MKTIASTGAFLVLVLATGPAVAQDPEITVVAPTDRSVAFAEAYGGYGFQFGEQDYLPKEMGGYKHPLTNGYALGAAAGWEFVRGLALVGNYQFASAQSRSGELLGALDDVQGEISYHILALGLRNTRALGPGRVFGEVGGGVILPFETQVNVAYGPALAAADITGTGSRTDEYRTGVGAYGQLGYQWDIEAGVYLAGGVRVQSFQSNNNGEQSRFDNFVTDFGAPQAMNTAITYDSESAVAPHTYSVQDLRLNIALGYRL
jgi:hypothetical protein